MFYDGNYNKMFDILRGYKLDDRSTKEKNMRENKVHLIVILGMGKKLKNLNFPLETRNFSKSLFKGRSYIIL